MKTLRFALAVALCFSANLLAGTKLDITGPFNSVSFGSGVTLLPNGNVVVTDPSFSPSGAGGAGAVYLYDKSGVLISSIRGGTANDVVGSGGVIVLANGNFVVMSPSWTAPGLSQAGAVTWGSATTGFIGGPSTTVSATNSLVGATYGSQVGSQPVVALANGNYVVRSPLAGDGSYDRVGAATWGNGATGIVGTVSAANSLMGSYDGDLIGQNIRVLTNGNYLVYSTTWANLSIGSTQCGSVTWCSATSATVGIVSASNSLIGGRPGTTIGSGGVHALTNGNYVVASPNWRTMADAHVGAVTWGNGTTGTSGEVGETNSLHGSGENDLVGTSVRTLTNGHYVVRSPDWKNGANASAGAATWCNGTTGATIGPVSTTNSIVGDQAGVRVSNIEIVPLTNGNYVIVSSVWSASPLSSQGAVTWATGTAPTAFVVGPANSLIGSSNSDVIGSAGVRPLTNGNYVVLSPSWDNGSATNAGSITWGSGTTGIKGPITNANSLVGTQTNDAVGSGGLTRLTNGNYVAFSPAWKNGSNAAAGAATFGNGKTAVKGAVSASNSLVGSSANDQVGSSGIVQLSNGNYVVCSPTWNGGAGAATWGSGSTGVKGVVSASNSLVGGMASDGVGNGVTALRNGHYVVHSPSWDKPSPALTNAGAVTWGNGTSGVKGLVTTTNSLTGSTASDLVGMSVAVLPNGSFVVGSPFWNNSALSHTDAGAATWADGISPLSGEVSVLNSLIGSSSGDKISDPFVTGTTDNHYIVRSNSHTNGFIGASGAISLGSGLGGTSGFINKDNSVLGNSFMGGTSLVFAYDNTQKQLWVGQPVNNITTLFVEGFVKTLASGKAVVPSPIQPATATFGAPGTISVNSVGGALFDMGLAGATGKDRVLLTAPAAGTPLDLVFQKGDSLSALPGFPSNAKVAAFSSLITQQNDLGIFKTTATGTGLTAANSQALYSTTASTVTHLLSTLSPVTQLGNAILTNMPEVLQSYASNHIALSYTLKASATTTPPVNAGNDSGIFVCDHQLSLSSANIIAREGSVAYGGGKFGAFSGRAVVGNAVFFPVSVTPITGASFQALFSMQADGASGSRIIAVGEDAPGLASTIDIASIPAVTQLAGQALYRATLKGTTTAMNEGIWLAGTPAPVLQKGTDISTVPTNLIPFKYTRILRYWSAGNDRVIVHAEISGSGVTTANKQVLVLVKTNGHSQILMRTGFPAVGTGKGKVSAISAVDVHPDSGRYVVLGSLSGTSTSSNQALWVGDSSLGNDTTQQVLRSPMLKLRKGQAYTTATRTSTIKSITLKPAADTAGAGGRGLSHVISQNGTIGLTLLGDNSISDLVLLP
ncbi:MAG: hypothetical protein JNJ83_15185 [Verrucomicrobiaceae bacterium]|nr:hypothetical protein [Verrucomicrobiaceae bacterium]